MSVPPTSRSSRLSMNSGPKRRTAKEVRFGAYVLGSTLGEGEFGKVKLGWRKDGKHPSQAAIKLIRRDSIPKGSEKENKVHREINALKRLAHPNIVRLEEVLQNEKYIGIVLEYASGGELFDYILEHRYLKESMACRLFAQLVSGVDYMHSKGIVHRDLKLENLLLDKHKNIIITDFGFVNTFRNSDLMKTSCGSPCYAAPELVVSSEPYEGRKVDVWSCGVILYAMLAGYLPFDDDPQNPDGDNIARLYHYITTTPLTFPEYIQPSSRDLLRKIIVPNPEKRIDLKQVRAHAWLAPHAPFLSVTPSEWDRNYTRARQSVPQQDKINRRLSLMENPSSASLMLNKPHSKSFAPKTNSSLLYSNPAAPQTSHTVAISSGSDNYHSPTTPRELYRSGREKAGSSASLVLQAVVEADKFEVSRRNSIQSDFKTSVPRSATFNEGTRTSRSNSIISANAPLNFETIAESPAQHSERSMLPPLLPPISRSTGAHCPNSAQTTTSISSKLPLRANRPRPTSYHPATASSGYMFPSPDLSFLVPANSSETSLTRPLFDRASSNSSSPVKEHCNSWCQPTEPILDKASASGVLTTLTDHGEKEEETETMKESEKRKSAAFDSLSNAIDIFSISSPTTTPNSPIMSSESTAKVETAKEQKVEPAGELKQAQVITAVEDTVKKVPEDNQLAELKSGIMAPISAPLSAPSRQSSISERRHEKENRNSRKSVSTSATSAPRFKRFSMLGFYSSNNLSQELQPSEPIIPPRKVLEPSNKRDDVAERRMTMGARREKDSTAKRVMDFFKRRSVRI
ncbi:hypothetical protein KL914_001207 [Ogataea haglerorum]|nr:hypothetical protein KL914_001207 [Ogataea haglerorum]